MDSDARWIVGESREEAEPEVFHVSHDSCTGDWKVTREGRPFALARAEDKERAVEEGRQLAERAGEGRLVVHREDGSLEGEC